MKKFIAWVKDTNGWVALPIIAACLVIMYGSILFHWNNFYSKGVHAASGWWHLAGWALTAGAVYTATKMNDRGSIIAFGVLVAFSWCAFTGFSF
jgi:hypothetical protein